LAKKQEHAPVAQRSTMHLCNTSLRQQIQPSVGLNHYMVARRASTQHSRMGLKKQKFKVCNASKTS